MTARVTFELSADLDVDCEAAEVVKRDLISLAMDRRVLYKDAPGTQKFSRK